MLRIEPVSSFRSPVMVSVPAAPVPPGLMVPWLIKPVVPLPTVIAPLPDKVPLLANPAVLLKVPPDETLIVPDWVNVVALTVRVAPVLACNKPLLVSPRLALPTVLSPAADVIVMLLSTVSAEFAVMG